MTDDKVEVHSSRGKRTKRKMVPRREQPHGYAPSHVASQHPAHRSALANWLDGLGWARKPGRQ